MGWHQVLDTLVQGQVHHLVVSVEADPDPDQLADHTLQALGRGHAED